MMTVVVVVVVVGVVVQEENNKLLLLLLLEILLLLSVLAPQQLHRCVFVHCWLKHPQLQLQTKRIHRQNWSSTAPNPTITWGE